jgi:hypothetical protein
MKTAIAVCEPERKPLLQAIRDLLEQARSLR